MSLSDAVKKLKFDNRLTDFYLKYGELEQKEVDKNNQSLEDVAHNAGTINIFDIDTDEEHKHQSH